MFVGTQDVNLLKLGGLGVVTDRRTRCLYECAKKMVALSGHSSPADYRRIAFAGSGIGNSAIYLHDILMIARHTKFASHLRE